MTTGILLCTLSLLICTADNATAFFGGLKGKIQKELDQNPFLTKEKIKLQVVEEQNGYVTIEMTDGDRPLRDAIHEGLDIYTDRTVDLLTFCGKCSAPALKTLKNALNYIRTMDDVKEISLTASVNTAIDRAEDLRKEAYELQGEEQVSKIRESAKLGDTYSQAILGDFHEKGQGVSQDYNKAIKWYKKSANTGNVLAMNALGKLLSTCPDSGMWDGRNAVRWAIKAVNQVPDSALYANTLAAAYARNGQYNDAVEIAEKSIQLLEKENWDDKKSKQKWLSEYQKQLELYKDKKPYQEVNKK